MDGPQKNRRRERKASIARTSAVLLFSAMALGLPARLPRSRTFMHNIARFETNLIASIESDGPGDRFVIERANISEQVVDRYTISLTRGKPYSAVSESGSAVIGAGSVVQFCGWGEFNGMQHLHRLPLPVQARRRTGVRRDATRLGTPVRQRRNRRQTACPSTNPELRRFGLKAQRSAHVIFAQIRYTAADPAAGFIAMVGR